MKNKNCKNQHPYYQNSNKKNDHLQLLSLCLEKEEICQQKFFDSSNPHRHENVVTLKELQKRLKQMEKEGNQALKKHLNLVGAMIQRFKMIEEFKKKIEGLEFSLIHQFQSLLNITEEIFDQEKINTKNIHQLQNSIKISNLEDSLFSDLTLKEEKVEIKNLKLNQLQEEKKLTFQEIDEKIFSIKDYCMKIIEVIMNTNEDEDDEFQEEESLNLVMKFYQRHKEYVLMRKESSKSEKGELKRSHHGHGKVHMEIQTEHFYHHQDNQNKQRNKQIFQQEKVIKKLQKEIDQLQLENENLRSEFGIKKLKTPRKLLKTPKKISQNTTETTETSKKFYF